MSDQVKKRYFLNQLGYCQAMKICADHWGCTDYQYGTELNLASITIALLPW